MLEGNTEAIAWLVNGFDKEVIVFKLVLHIVSIGESYTIFKFWFIYVHYQFVQTRFLYYGKAKEYY